MTDRKAFEDWYEPPFDTDGALFSWSAWQASRKQALEDVFKWMEKRNETHQYMNECVKLMKKEIK